MRAHPTAALAEVGHPHGGIVAGPTRSFAAVKPSGNLPPHLTELRAETAEAHKVQWKSSESREKYAYYYFREVLGLSPIRAAGLVGNLSKESTDIRSHKSPLPRLVPGLHEVGGAGIGIAQWTTTDRQEALKTYSRGEHLPWQDFGAELDFVVQELKTGGLFRGKLLEPDPTVFKQLQHAQTLEQATTIVEQGYLRPHDWREVGHTSPQSASWHERYRDALRILHAYGS